jgi:TPR repeat protein
MGNRKINKILFCIWLSLSILVFTPLISFGASYTHSDLDFMEKAQGFKGNNEKALNFLIKGTEDGIAIAQVYLAKTYYFGWLDVKKDYDKSFKLTKEMALKDYGEAQDLLGLHYAGGRGVEKNLINALTFALLSRSNVGDFLNKGDFATPLDMIKETIKIYKSKMPDWAIIQAKEKARECWSSQFLYCEEDALGSKSSTKEEQLKQAKALFTKELITDEVYKKLKGLILGLN